MGDVIDITGVLAARAQMEDLFDPVTKEEYEKGLVYELSHAQS